MGGLGGGGDVAGAGGGLDVHIQEVAGAIDGVDRVIHRRLHHRQGPAGVFGSRGVGLDGIDGGAVPVQHHLVGRLGSDAGDGRGVGGGVAGGIGGGERDAVVAAAQHRVGQHKVA